MLLESSSRSFVKSPCEVILVGAIVALGLGDSPG